MKRNLALFGVFVCLMIMTYLFQEKRVEKEYDLAQNEDKLFDFEITHLKLPVFEVEKKNGGWWSGEDLLSHNAFKQIEKKLSEIKKNKSIEGKWETFFPHPFSFEVNHKKWTIGDLSLDKQAFYIAEGDKISLAVIEGGSTQLTQDESEIEALKLNELITLLSKSKAELKETQLFRFYPNLPMERVVLSVEGSLPFELNFKDHKTEPPPISGITVHKDLAGKFFSLLTQVNIKQELPYSDKLKFKKLGELKFLNDSSAVTWELWLKSKNSADAVIIDPVKKKSYLMLGGSLRVFFIQIQDYWDKKVIPQKDFTSFTRTNAIFIQGDKKAVVTILNREPLGFDVQGHRVDQARMEFLIQFLFNLGAKDQAERVSLLSKTEKQQLLSEDRLRIEIMGQELILWRKTEELIVVNLTQGFKAHFNLLDESFNGKFEDVLK